MFTIDSKLSLHRICAHLLAAEFLGIIIHVFDVVLIAMSNRYDNTIRQLTSNLPSVAIARARARSQFF